MRLWFWKVQDGKILPGFSIYCEMFEWKLCQVKLVCKIFLLEPGDYGETFKVVIKKLKTKKKTFRLLLKVGCGHHRHHALMRI